MTQLSAIPKPHRRPPLGQQCRMPLSYMREGTRSYSYHQKEMRSRNGCDPDFCCSGASYVLDGIPYCELHAGQTLIERLLKASHD